MGNLNAEQIKKALERCANEWHCGVCGFTENECALIKKSAIALIKSQEHRIADLEKYNSDMKVSGFSAKELAEKCERLDEENERLRADKDYWEKRAKESESEYDQAVKRGYKLGAVDYVYSFVEKLKAETITIQDHIGKLGLVVLVGTIDQIANELLNGEGMCNEK